jgi:hypothetical protein
VSRSPTTPVNQGADFTLTAAFAALSGVPGKIPRVRAKSLKNKEYKVIREIAARARTPVTVKIGTNVPVRNRHIRAVCADGQPYK